MLTVDGAVALGVEDRFGVLEPGMQADLAAFALPTAEDPEAIPHEHGGGTTLAAVVAGR